MRAWEGGSSGMAVGRVVVTPADEQRRCPCRPSATPSVAMSAVPSHPGPSSSAQSTVEELVAASTPAVAAAAAAADDDDASSASDADPPAEGSSSTAAGPAAEGDKKRKKKKKSKAKKAVNALKCVDFSPSCALALGAWS